MGAVYQRRLVLLAVGVPALIAILSAAVLGAALPGLPREVPVHWSVTGVADGFAPPAVVLVALPASIGFGAIVWAILRVPANVRSAGTPRLLTGASIFFATVVSGGVTGSTLAAGRDGALPWLLVLASFALGAVLGAGGALLLPTPPPGAPRDSIAVPPVALRRSERVVWVGSAAPSPALSGSLVVVAAVLATLAVLLGVLVHPVLLVLLVPALAAGAASSGWRVRIDDRGVVVRGVLPPFVIRIELAALADARITSVAPVSDFGGWGVRHRRGVTAVVSRAGEALELERTDGRRLLVTVGGAREAASVATALLARRVPQQH